jgi:hypothetical protein
MTAGLFCRLGDGGEAHLSVGTNSIGLVEIVVLGVGKATVLILASADAACLVNPGGGRRVRRPADQRRCR